MKNIFVGNLDFAATESSIRALFEPHGNVERVNLVTDRDTGRSRGFAFVEMTDSAEADRAIAALNGTELNGRALNINDAEECQPGQCRVARQAECVADAGLDAGSGLTPDERRVRAAAEPGGFRPGSRRQRPAPWMMN